MTGVMMWLRLTVGVALTAAGVVSAVVTATPGHGPNLLTIIAAAVGGGVLLTVRRRRDTPAGGFTVLEPIPDPEPPTGPVWSGTPIYDTLARETGGAP